MMAAPSYTNDLTDLFDFDVTIPTVAEPTTYSAGRSPLDDDTDNPIQGTVHGSLTANTTGNAGMVGTGTAFTWTTGHYMFGWVIWTAPSTINPKSTGGLVMIVGESSSVYRVYYAGGADFGKYPYGGYQNFVVDPTVTGDNDNGTPTTYNVAGGGAAVHSAVSKGNPLAIDVFRYGRGEFRVDDGSLADGYANFDAMALVNDANTARWGLFEAISGGYKFKGHMILGYATAVEFVDSNVTIVVDITDYVSADFNKIEVRNIASVVDWSNITITQLGVGTTYATVSKCSFVVTDNASITKNTCTFIDFDTFAYLSNSSLINSTYRRCGLVTQGGATFTSCTFDEPSGTVGITVDNLSLVTKTTFNSDGTGHAIDMGTISANTNKDWDNFESGYASTNGSTGNETILVNVASGITLTISVQTGASTPTYYNTGIGTVTVVSGQVTVEVTNVVINSLVYVATLDASGDDSTVLINEIATTSTVGTSVTFGDLDFTAVTIVVRYASGATKYYPIRESGTITAGGMSYTANQRINTIAT